VLHDCHAPFSLRSPVAPGPFPCALFFRTSIAQHHPWLLAACVRALISILKRLYKIQQATQVACSPGEGWGVVRRLVAAEYTPTTTHRPQGNPATKPSFLVGGCMSLLLPLLLPSFSFVV